LGLLPRCMDEWSFFYLHQKANGPVSKVIHTLCMRRLKKIILCF
jgi:hypothetical protein